MITSSRVVFAIVIFLEALQCRAGCFIPNGTNINTEIYDVDEGWNYAPCDNVAAVSMCCSIGPGRQETADRCIPGGLCYNPGADLYWRESCTDPTWEDPACVKLFLNDTGAEKDVVITPCDNGSWCYGNGPGADACCRNGEGYFVVDGKQTRQNPNDTTPSTRSATSSSISTREPTASASSSPSEEESSGLSTGAKAGIGVGAGLAVLVAVVAATVFFRNRRRRHSMLGEQLRIGEEQTKLGNQTNLGLRFAELDQPEVRYEMSSSTRYSHLNAHEMDARDPNHETP